MRDRLRTIYYRIKYQHLLKKATIGKATRIRCRLQIRGPGKITIGAGCIFEPDPWGDDYITLYTHQPEAQITIGNRVVLRATRFGCHKSITVGDESVLENVSIYDSDFHNIDATKRDQNFNEGDRNVVIGAETYLGCECLCSKGTVVGQQTILLPASVIGTKTIPGGKITCGNPARVIGVSARKIMGVIS